MGKFRVSPVKSVSVPHLELTVTTIAVKLSTFVCNQLEFKFNYVYYWTAATIFQLAKDDKRYGMVIKVQDVCMLEIRWFHSPPTGSLSAKDTKEATKQIVKLV